MAKVTLPREATPLCIVSGIPDCVNKAIDTLTLVVEDGGRILERV